MDSIPGEDARNAQAAPLWRRGCSRMAFAWNKMKFGPLSGVAFLWAWSFSFVLVKNDNLSASLVWAQDAVYLGSSAAALVVCLILFWRRHSERVPMRRLIGWMTLLLGAASVCIVAGTALSDVALMLAGKALAGPGQGVSWVLWTYAISRYDLEEIEASFLSWMIVLAAILGLFSLVEQLADSLQLGFRLALLLILAALSGLTFRASVEKSFSNSDDAVPPVEERMAPTSLLRSVGWLFFCLGAALCASMVVTSLSQQTMELPANIVQLLYALAALLMFPVAWVVLHVTRRFGPTSLYRWAVPLLVAGMVFSLLPADHLEVVACLCFALVAIGFEGMYHLLFVYAAKRFSSRGLAVATLGILATTIGGFVGSAVVSWGLGHPDTLLTLMLVAVLAFVVVASLTPRSEGISGLGQDENEDGQPLNGRRAPDSEVAPWAEFAAQYGLTPREVEVLELLMQGRSRTFIRETLYISKGTVDTHINHIYRKAGVTSKEGLERLVFGNDNALA